MYVGVRVMPYEPTHKKRIEAISKVFQKGKIQLPAVIREALNIKDGNKIIWIIEDGKWVVEKA